MGAVNPSTTPPTKAPAGVSNAFLTPTGTISGKRAAAPPERPGGDLQRVLDAAGDDLGEEVSRHAGLEEGVADPPPVGRDGDDRRQTDGDDDGERLAQALPLPAGQSHLRSRTSRSTSC